MRGLFGVAGALAVLVGGAAGQEAVTFKDYAYKVGDKTRTTKTEDGTVPEGNSTTTMKIALDAAPIGVSVKVDIDVKLTNRTERVGGGKR